MYILDVKLFDKINYLLEAVLFLTDALQQSNWYRQFFLSFFFIQKRRLIYSNFIDKFSTANSMQGMLPICIEAFMVAGK